jgi:hypothetical protein
MERKKLGGKKKHQEKRECKASGKSEFIRKEWKIPAAAATMGTLSLRTTISGIILSRKFP